MSGLKFLNDHVTIWHQAFLGFIGLCLFGFSLEKEKQFKMHSLLFLFFLSPSLSFVCQRQNVCVENPLDLHTHGISSLVTPLAHCSRSQKPFL